MKKGKGNREKWKRVLAFMLVLMLCVSGLHGPYNILANGVFTDSGPAEESGLDMIPTPDTGTENSQQDTGTESNEQDTGTESNEQDTGTESNEQDTGTESNEQDTGTESNEQDTGTESNEQDTGTESNKQDTGTESIQQTLGTGGADISTGDGLSSNFEENVSGTEGTGNEGSDIIIETDQTGSETQEEPKTLNYGDLSMNVEVTEKSIGTIPEGAWISFTAVPADDPKYIKAVEKLNEEADVRGYEVKGLWAYDISIRNVQGSEINPGPTDVKITYVSPEAPEAIAGADLTQVDVKTLFWYMDDTQETPELQLRSLGSAPELTDAKELQSAEFQMDRPGTVAVGWEAKKISQPEPTPEPEVTEAPEEGNPEPTPDPEATEAPEEEEPEPTPDPEVTEIPSEDLSGNGDKTEQDENSGTDGNEESNTEESKTTKIKIIEEETSVYAEASVNSEVIGTAKMKECFELLETINDDTDTAVWYRILYHEAEGYVEAEKAETVAEILPEGLTGEAEKPLDNKEDGDDISGEKIPEASPDSEMQILAIEGEKEFQYENEEFTLDLYLEGTMKIPVETVSEDEKPEDSGQPVVEDETAVINAGEQNQAGIENFPGSVSLMNNGLTFSSTEIPETNKTSESNEGTEMNERSVPEMKESLETDGISVTDETPKTDNASGTNETLGTDNSSGTNETPETDNTSGTNETLGTDNTSVTDETPETDNASGTDETPETDNTSGTDETLGTDNTSGTDETPETDNTSGTNETLETDTSSSPETISWEDISIETVPIEEGSETFEQLEQFAREQNGEDELFSLSAMKFSFLYGETELDVSDCTLTVNITPKETILNHIERMEDDFGSQSVLQIFGDTSDTESHQGKPAPEAETGVVLSAIQRNAVQTTELNNVLMKEKDEEISVLTVSIKADEILAVAAAETANPNFTVQYYAYVEQMSTSGSNALTVIDTDNGGKGQGGKLPQNGVNLKTKNLYLDQKSGRYHVAINKNTVVPVYNEKKYEYIQAPNLTYFNRLYENGNYKLKEVWILKNGKSPTSTKKTDWTIYSDPGNLHFTNRKASAEADTQTILIDQGAVIRLVFDTTSGNYGNEAVFYDYDITDGKLYKTNNRNGGTYSSQNNSNTIHAYTKEQGINNTRNYRGSGTKLAFGNTNTGTGLGGVTWSGQQLNKFNENNRSTGGKGCTFGLVSGLDGKGNIVYSGGVDAPNLFNEGTAAGKTVFNDYSLNFKRDGDTYTLTSVSGTGASNLDSFFNPQSYNQIFTNNFWPMDSASSYGTSGHDLKFGNNSLASNRKFFGASNGTLPKSDDGPDHNSYFGMQYAVNFTLTEDYIGPLEYYFFGDDDMWVFLDNKLVCDIGGVHSSVGEYVNLWDYIKKGTSGSHTLSFFYTERGSSGSTCYMRFTLPSVSSVTPEQNTGTLRVEKEVIDSRNIDKEFNFKIHFTDADGTKLKDDYSYTRYDENGNVIKTDVIIYDGGTFQLRDKEYIIVKYLPVGARYTVEEVGVNQNELNVYKTTVSINNGQAVEGRKATGSIELLKEDNVKYVNQFYELPSTGGIGIYWYTISGMLFMMAAGLILYKNKCREVAKR